MASASSGVATLLIASRYFVTCWPNSGSSISARYTIAFDSKWKLNSCDWSRYSGEVLVARNTRAIGIQPRASLCFGGKMSTLDPVNWAWAIITARPSSNHSGYTPGIWL